MTPPFHLTTKALTILALCMAVAMWFFKAAKGLHMPFGMTTDDVLTGLGNLGILLGINGAGLLPGQTLLKNADAVREQIAVQATQIADDKEAVKP